MKWTKGRSTMGIPHDIGGDSKNQQLSEPPGQPGLEVVAQEHRRQSQQWIQVVPNKYDNSTYPEYHEAGLSPQKDPPEFNRRGRRRLWLTIGGIILVLIIIAAIVGGVLGSRARRDGGDPDALNNSTVALNSIRQGSGLSVIAWRKRNRVEIYLYYQGRDGKVRFSKYDSGRGLVTVNNSYWEEPAALNTNARPNARIASAMILWGQDYVPQTEFFYTTSDNRLLEVSYNTQYDPDYAENSINGEITGVNSSIAAYWPYIVFQDSIGELNEALNPPAYDTQLRPTGSWTTRRLGVTGIDTTKLAIVPLFTNYSNIIGKGGYGVFYQRSDGQLSAFIPDSDSLPANYTSSWPASSFLSISIPKGNSIAAFATARPNDSQGRVNTYLLYQDSDSRINMVWADGDNAWKTSKPVALASSDQGSDIACLTMPTSHRDIHDEELLLEQASTETRCYFQRGGLVREVMLSGTDWVELGSIPMP